MDARYPYEDNRYPPQERDKGRLYDSRPMDPYPSQDSAYNSSLDKPRFDSNLLDQIIN